MKPICVAAILCLCFTMPATASTFTVLGPITGPHDGAGPVALVRLNGKLYGTTASGGLYGGGVVYELAPNSGRETVIYNYRQSGSSPRGLIALDGLLYTTEQYGGANRFGSVFSLNPATGKYTLLHSFTGSDGAGPGDLTVANGTIYGTTASGGGMNSGAVFSIDATTGAVTLLYSFPFINGGYYPAGQLLYADGLLYGTTTQGGDKGYGTVFSVDPVARTGTIIYSFPELQPPNTTARGVIKIGNFLYGTLWVGGKTKMGAIYRLDPVTGIARVVYSFPGGDGGANPDPGLVSIGPVLYGTTSAGGAGGVGLLFSFDVAGKTAAVLYSFTGEWASGLEVFENRLFGTTNSVTSYTGTVFSFDFASDTPSLLYRFYDSGAYGSSTGVTNIGGAPYVTASAGGDLAGGDVLRVEKALGRLKQIFSFATGPGAPGGTAPQSPLVSLGGALFGESAGGASGDGTVFRIDPVSHAETILHSFTDTPDGRVPSGLAAADGFLYGTTLGGGAGGNGLGTIFRIDPASGTETILYSFGQGIGDGSYPVGLTQVGSLFYGLTYGGGSKSNGTLFSFDPASVTETVLYSFGGRVDYNPPGVMVSVRNKLYGTRLASRKTEGEIFEFDPATGREKTIYEFKGGTDGHCWCGLASLGRTLFGTTTDGGATNHGTIFRLDPRTGVKTTLYEFTGKDDGASPDSLAQFGDALYGTTGLKGASALGTVFKIIP